MNNKSYELSGVIIRKSSIHDSEHGLIEFLYRSIYSSSLQECESVPEEQHSHQDRRED
jgi:hypothetical protein